MTTTEGKQFGYSPDIGKFVSVGGRVFTEYGKVFSNRTSAWRVYQHGPEAFNGAEDYSAWSDEKRAEVSAHWDAVWAKNKAEHDERERVFWEEVKVIEAKLTADEIDTLRAAYRD